MYMCLKQLHFRFGSFWIFEHLGTKLDSHTLSPSECTSIGSIRYAARPSQLTA